MLARPKDLKPQILNCTKPCGHKLEVCMALPPASWLYVQGRYLVSSHCS